MASKVVLAGLSTAAALSLALSLSPAQGTRADKFDKKAILRQVTAHEVRDGIGSFTPAAADPRLAAVFAHSGIMSTGFRFTPSGNAVRLGRGITVAVRARSTADPRFNVSHVALSAVAPVTSVAYNLGVALGWKKFALTTDYTKMDSGLIQGGRESADIGLSFNAPKWSSRVGLIADRPTANAPRALGATEDVAVDVGGAYRLTHNLDVTAGLRYKRERDRDRLDPLVDTKRDSQAVYVGTQFKF